MPLIVAATGTDVGKTLFSALVMARYAATTAVRYFKPVQTGDADDTAQVLSLSGLSADRALPNLYRFPLAASPHYAAEQAGSPIDELRLERELRAELPATLIELAGGLMVPLKRTYTNLNLISALGYPVVLVAATGLGTINHSVLSHSALVHAGVHIAGLFFVGKADPLRADNMRTVLEMTGLPGLGDLLLPDFTLGPASLQQQAREFDKAELLAGYFR